MTRIFVYHDSHLPAVVPVPKTAVLAVALQGNLNRKTSSA